MLSNFDWIVYPQVVDVMKKIKTAIDTGHSKLVVMMPTQSGKTAISQAISDVFLSDKDLKFYVTYLCADAKVSYRKQINKDLGARHNPALFSVRLAKNLETLDLPDNKTNVVIIDEAGYGVSANQRLHKALKNKNISLIIAVSATPYEAMFQWNDVVITPSTESLVGYTGLGDYLAAGKIHHTAEYPLVDTASAFTELFNKALLLISDSKPLGIVRAKTEEQAKAIASLLKKKKIQPVIWNQANPLPLDMTPFEYTDKEFFGQHTVLIVVKHLSMGVRISDRNLAFVWDSGSEFTKNNTLIQGLPGRVCGWDKGKTGLCHIFTNTTHVIDYVNLWKELRDGDYPTLLNTDKACQNIVLEQRMKTVITARLVYFATQAELDEYEYEGVKIKQLLSSPKSVTGSDSKVYFQRMANATDGRLQSKSLFNIDYHSYSGRNFIEFAKAVKEYNKNKTSTNFQQFKRYGSEQADLEKFEKVKLGVFLFEHDYFKSQGFPKGSALLFIRNEGAVTLPNKAKLKPGLFSIHSEGESHANNE